MHGRGSSGAWSDLGLRKEPQAGEVAPRDSEKGVRAPHTLCDREGSFAVFTVALGWFPLKRPQQAQLEGSPVREIGSHWEDIRTEGLELTAPLEAASLSVR